MIGDAGVGAFEAVSDAQIAEHVIGQRLKQPGGIYARAQLFAESLKFAAGGRERGQEIVLIMIGNAAAAGVNGGPFVEGLLLRFVQRVPVSNYPCILDGAAGGEQPQ